MQHITDEQIEASRQKLGIPADWSWTFCAGQCGDIVWMPPEIMDIAKVAPVCSALCAQSVMARVAEGKMEEDEL